MVKNLFFNKSICKILYSSVYYNVNRSIVYAKNPFRYKGTSDVYFF